MMEIWKQIDKAFSPNNREAEAINSQLSVEYIMEEKDMLSHVNSTFCKKTFLKSSMMLTGLVYKSILFPQHYEMFLQQRFS